MPVYLGPLGANGQEYFFPGEVAARPLTLEEFNRAFTRAIQTGFPRCWYCDSVLVTDDAYCPHCGGKRKDRRCSSL